MHDTAPIDQPTIASRFLRHVMRMPAWHRHVLIAAMAFAAIGTVGRVRQLTSTPAGAPSGTVTAPATPHSNFNSTDSAANLPATDSSAQPWYLSPKFLSAGGSVLGGFLIGWVMRVFLKTTLLVGTLLASLFGGLSYFHVMNVDFTSVQQQYNRDASWVNDQATRLKDIAIEHLPVHAGGLLGMFLGFRRPRL